MIKLISEKNDLLLGERIKTRRNKQNHSMEFGKLSNKFIINKINYKEMLRKVGLQGPGGLNQLYSL